MLSVASKQNTCPTRWSRDHINAIELSPHLVAPEIAWPLPPPPLPDRFLWDFWPVETPDGSLATWGGCTFWMILSSEVMADPEDRHTHARIRLLAREEDRFIDLGPVFPDDFSPGSREWSGSAVVDREMGKITVFFTAAGRRGEIRATFEQRIFETTAPLHGIDGRIDRTSWSPPKECLVADPEFYLPAKQTEGAAGSIKAFRDPAYFQDPRTGMEFLFFTGSANHSVSQWNGVIGAAIRQPLKPTGWQLLPPVITADGLNNELERPHMRYKDGLYYLFWSTQEKVFAAGGPKGPTGLYGMVGKNPIGPFRPLNQSGLVAANPPSRPTQAYSWLVMDDLRVASFVDYPIALSPDNRNAACRAAAFGGQPAPFFSILLDACETRIVAPAQV